LELRFRRRIIIKPVHDRYAKQLITTALLIIAIAVRRITKYVISTEYISNISANIQFWRIRRQPNSINSL
jgi:hypothetical protein